jgi:hypothetical protein
VKKRPAAQARSGPEAIPGAVVQDLVQRNERQIDGLRRELDAALEVAEEAEERAAALSGTPPPGAPPDGTSGYGKHSQRPRTTVVTRPKPTPPRSTPDR